MSRKSQGNHEAGRYEIRMRGRVDERWADWFDGLSMAAQGGETVLSGELSDQAALHGVLARLRDLGLPLISVTRVG